MWGDTKSDVMYDTCCVGVMCQCGLGLMGAILFMRGMLWVFLMWWRLRCVRINDPFDYCRFEVGCVTCIMCGFGFFCDCAYLCGIGVECLEDQEANKSERKYRCVGIFEDVVFDYMMSDASVSVIEKCIFVQE